MQPLDPGDQEDRVPHCVIQPVVLWPFHIAAPSEDNQTDYILLDISSASDGPSFPLMLCTLSGHPVQCTMGTQWTQKY